LRACIDFQPSNDRIAKSTTQPYLIVVGFIEAQIIQYVDNFI